MFEEAFSLDSLETPTLTKAHLARALFDKLGLNKRESKDMVDIFFDLIAAQLIKGEEVKILNFGNFQVRQKSQRPGRNPRTGESFPIEARRSITFHASDKLRAQLQSAE